MIAGPIQIVASVVGALSAGAVIDTWGRRGRSDAALLFSIIAIALLVPLVVFAALAPSAAAGIAGLSVAWILMGALLPAPGVALQLTVPPARLALASALFMLTANLIGMGLRSYSGCTDHALHFRISRRAGRVGCACWGCGIGGKCRAASSRTPPSGACQRRLGVRRIAVWYSIYRGAHRP